VENFANKKLKWFLPIVAFLAILLFMFYTWRGYGFGYPLDDAWIHQTYARNMADYGQWMFIPGVVSGGSTSPLWTLLLTPAHLVGFNPVLWTTILGFISLVMLGWLAYLFLREQTEINSTWWLAGIVLLEWHFVWAALSGMETLLQTILNLGIAIMLYRIIQKSGTPYMWMWLGLIIGASIWVRPDSITWIGPAGLLALVLFWKKENYFLKKAGFFLIGFMIPVAGYLVFNLQVAGSIWPNTMYAKQAEYQAHLSIPFLTRFMQLLILPFIGSSFLLIPGLVYKVWQIFKQKHVYLISIFLWWIGMIFIYAMKLPVTYQHGRYMIPTMIMPILLGLLGTIDLYQHLHIPLRWKDRLSFAGKAMFIGLQIAFLFLGAQAFSDDVGVIETEMVQTAVWVRDHLPDDAILAVHDIGAMGFYSEHSFYDLAGLINPEVIPFIRDEHKLAAFLDETGTQYVVVFPSWYETMLLEKGVYYSTRAVLSPSLGGENMTIFCWEKCR
jgi:hypothetical protein